MTTRRRKRTARTPGPKPRPAAGVRSVNRSIRLLPDEARVHDMARGDEPWTSWMLEAARLRIAEGK